MSLERFNITLGEEQIFIHVQVRHSHPSQFYIDSLTLLLLYPSFDIILMAFLCKQNTWCTSTECLHAIIQYDWGILENMNFGTPQLIRLEQRCEEHRLSEASARLIKSNIMRTINNLRVEKQRQTKKVLESPKLYKGKMLIVGKQRCL